MTLRFFSLLLGCFFCSGIGFTQHVTITPYEKQGGKSTPRYTETINYCRELAAFSPLVKMQSIGKSAQGRDIQILIVDKKQNFTPEAVHRSGNVVLMVQACIHAGEPDGKDAMQLLLRDMLVKGIHKELLDHVTLLFIPIFNTDGHERFGPYNRINQNGPTEMGWRTTAQNLNLNRDYLKADAPEMQAWLRNLNKWNPDFFIDTHVTDGADYQYKITYSLELGGNMEAGLTNWTRDYYEKSLVKLLDDDAVPAFPYVQFRNWHDPRSGLYLSPAPPMLSTGYFAVRNRPALLIETHMLKAYPIRVEATYKTIQHTLELLNNDHQKFLQVVKNADDYTASAEFKNKPFPVKFATSYKDSVLTSFKGVEYEGVKSDVSGGEWFIYHPEKPVTMQIPFFTKAEPVTMVQLPEAYVVPVEWTEVINRIKLHGLKYTVLNKPTIYNVNSYRFSNVKYRPASYEGRFIAQFVLDTITQNREYQPGSIIVPMNQPLARIAAYLLEPSADGSLASWGFFTAVMEQKEYTESYVMERMAREMLAKDAKLKLAFEQKRVTDPRFANDPDAILNWFYSKTPYWDQQLNLYPIGRLMNMPVKK